jgi:hypothetical protein
MYAKIYQAKMKACLYTTKINIYTHPAFKPLPFQCIIYPIPSCQPSCQPSYQPCSQPSSQCQGCPK